MNTNDEELNRVMIGCLTVAVAVGVLSGLAAGKAIWKEEKVPPHDSFINTNHEVLLPSTQHLIALLAQIDSDIDRMLAWTSNAIVVLRDSREWPTWTNTDTTITNWAQWELIVTNSYSNYTIHFPNFPDSKKIKWGKQATNSS